MSARRGTGARLLATVVAGVLLIGTLLGGASGAVTADAAGTAGNDGSTFGNAPATDADWPEYGATGRNTGHNPDAAGPTDAVGTAWTFGTDATEFSTGASPAVVGDTVYVAGENTVYAVNATAGTERWRVDADKPVGPAFHDGGVYVADEGRVRAVDAETGARVWETDIGDRPVGSVTAVDGVIYVVTRTNDGGSAVIALDAADGDVGWRYAPDATLADAAPTVDPDAGPNGTVYVGGAGLSAVDAATGRERWQYEVKGNVVPSAPAAADGVVYAGDDEGRLYAVDTGGNEIWTTDVGDDRLLSPAVANGTVYVGMPRSDRFVGLDADTGATEWETNLPVGLGAAPSVASDTVYVTDRTARILALDADDGTERWRFDLPGSRFLYQSPAVRDGVVYVGNASYDRTKSNASLYALGERPSLSATTDDTTVAVGESVTFEADVASGWAGIASIEWDLDGDGIFEATGESATETFDERGGRAMTVRATDQRGVTNTTSVYVGVDDPTERPATGDWRVSGGDIARAGVASNLPGLRSADVRWRRNTNDVDANPPPYNPPAVVDGTTYAAAYRTNATGVSVADLRAFDADTGVDEWRASLGAVAFADYTVTNDTVYVATAGRESALRAIDRDTGAERWAIETPVDPFRIAYDPGVGLLYVTTLEGGDVVALDPTSFADDSPPDRPVWSTSSGPLFAVGNDSLYAVDSEVETSTVTAVNKSAGAERWNVSLDGRATEPVVAGDTVIVGTQTQRLIEPLTIHALDVETGAERWTFGADTDVRPAVADGLVFVATDAGEVGTLNLTTGDPRWGVNTAVDSGFGTGPSLDRFAVTNDTVYVSPQPDRLLAFDTETGEERFRIERDREERLVTGIAAYENRIVVTTPTGIETLDGPTPPVADAGPNRTEAVDQRVELDATGTVDPTGYQSRLVYDWRQVTGPAVDLDAADTATPAFKTPRVENETALVFRVTVIGADGLNDTATVAVTVDPSIALPAPAVTVEPAEPEEGETVTLDAGPTEPGDAPINRFEWTLPNGTAAGETTTAAFEQPGEYAVSLRVVDADGVANETVRTVTVTERTADPAEFPSGADDGESTPTSTPAKEPTPTPEPTPTSREPTPTPTDEQTPTATDAPSGSGPGSGSGSGSGTDTAATPTPPAEDGVPGFGAVAAVLALAIASLVARRGA